MKSNLRLLLILLLPLSLFSCKKGGDSAYDAEMRKLNAWILVNNITVTPTASGMYFIPVEEGTGATPVDLDFFYYNYSVETLEGKIVESSVDSIADAWGYKTAFTHFAPNLRWLAAQYNGPLKGISEAARLMKEGGKARLILPSTLAFGDRGYGSIGANTSVIINLELIKIVKDIVTYETDSLVGKYATANSMNLTIPEKVGIYYKTVISKVPADAGKFMKDSAKTVKVWYIGKFLDGFVFDTNKKEWADSLGIYNSTKTYSLLSVELGKFNGVSAFEDVIKEMWKREKTILVTTSAFAYGPNGNGTNIPGYTPLVFEITVDSTYIKK